MTQTVVCALYKFVTLDDFEKLRQPLLKTLLDHNVRGTLLLAHEGINGTIAGSRQAIDQVLDSLEKDPRLAPLETKESLTEKPPFKRTKVKLKKEIVTMGIPGIDPNRAVGTYLSPEEWNKLLQDPEVLLVDTRNDYEYQVGTFRHAINPKTTTFREFPRYIRENLDPEKHKKVAMFCTGGIRCEKATAYMKELGFDEVYHLKGGILKYLEDMPVEKSVWEGECFVFDDRVTVNHQLERGQYDQCNACRMPITRQDQQSEYFIQGVSCPHCHDKHTDEQKARFAEREKQVQLARQRGEAHIGTAARQRIEINRQQKHDARKRARAVSAQVDGSRNSPPMND